MIVGEGSPFPDRALVFLVLMVCIAASSLAIKAGWVDKIIIFVMALTMGFLYLMASVDFSQFERARD